MPKVDVPTEAIVARRDPGEVLGLGKTGPSSRGSTYWRRLMSCPREHLFANVLGWRPRSTSDPLDTGLVWHFVLEAYYKAMQRLQRGDPAIPNLRACEQTAFEVLHAFADEPQYEDIYEVVERMLGSYFDRWRDYDLENWEIISVEVELRNDPKAWGFSYTNRLDLVIIDTSLGDRVTRVVEHKSAGRLDDATLTGYTQDLQTLGHVWLAQHHLDWDYYPPFLGSLVNVSTKTKEPRHERIPVQPSPEALEAWEDALAFWAQFRDQTEREGFFPKNFAQCTRRFGRCPFFGICRAMPDTTPAEFRAMHDKDELPVGYVR